MGNPTRCKYCGCTEARACQLPGGGTCYWIVPGVCSACATSHVVSVPLDVLHILFTGLQQIFQQSPDDATAEQAKTTLILALAGETPELWHWAQAAGMPPLEELQADAAAIADGHLADEALPPIILATEAELRDLGIGLHGPGHAHRPYRATGGA